MGPQIDMLRKMADSGGIEIEPASLKDELKDVIGKGERGLDVSSHARNFFDCIKSREKPAAHSGVMRRSHVACHAAALSWILKRKLRVDPANEQFVNDDEANGMLRREYRKPYVVPDKV